MGDRAIIIFRDKKNGEHSPAIYLHWSAYAVAEYLRRTHKLMLGRGADLNYTAARFVGVCHEDIEGNMSLGMWNVGEIPENPGELSHGDAGLILVDIRNDGNGLVYDCEAFDGYGLLVATDFDAMRAGDHSKVRKHRKLKIAGGGSEYFSELTLAG